MVFLNALEGVLVLVLIGVTGYVIAARKWIGEETRHFLPRLITNISLPPYLMMNIMEHMERDHIFELLKGVLAPMISVITAFFLALLMAFVFRVHKRHRGLFCASVSNSNTIFIGIPVNIALFGNESMPFVLLYYIASTIFFWTVGQCAIIYDKEAKKGAFFRHVTLSKILSPPLLGFLTGLLLTICGVELPVFVKSAAVYLGNITTPLSMMFIGISMYDIGMIHIRPDKDMILLIFGRMIMAPCLMFLLTQLFSLPPLMTKVFVVQSSLPVMMQAAILSAYYDADKTFGSEAVAATTLLSIFFIPILMTILH